MLLSVKPLCMKKLSATVYPSANSEGNNGNVKIARPKKERNVYPLPPNEETLERLNAMAKGYPFCIMYKEKNNDPL